MSDLYALSLDALMKEDQALLKKIEKDVRRVKAEKRMTKFAWLSIVVGIILIAFEEIFEENPLIDFVSGALPWILLGLMFLSAILYLNHEEKE